MSAQNPASVQGVHQIEDLPARKCADAEPASAAAVRPRALRSFVQQL